MDSINQSNTIKFKKKLYLLGAFIFLGMCLTTPFTALDPIFTIIAHDLHTSVSSLGFLTTLPLIMFAIISFIVPFFSNRFRLEKIFAWVLALMTVGSIVRIFGLFWLYVGTCLIGIAVAFLNVLMPVAVKRYFPNKVGKYTAIYVSSMMITMSLANAVVVPITKRISWKGVVLGLSIIILIFFAYMLLSIFFKSLKDKKVKYNTKIKKLNAWINYKAWIVLLFIGVQSILFYIYLTWVPTLMIDYNVRPAIAGILSGIYSLLGLPFSIFLPEVITKVSKKARLWGVIILSSMVVVGTIMLFVRTSNIIYWCVIIFFLGCSTGSLYPYFMTILSEKTSSAAASAAVSGMSQTGGYLLAAIGPALFGYCFKIFPTISLISVAILGIIQTICIILVEKSDIIM